MVPQVIRGLVIYGDSIWNPGFKNSLDATLDTCLVQGAYERQPVYAPAIGLGKPKRRVVQQPEYVYIPSIGSSNF